MHLTRSGRLKAARPQPPGGGGGRFIRAKELGCNQALGTVNRPYTFERQLMRRKCVGPTASLTCHCMLAPLRLLPRGPRLLPHSLCKSINNVTSAASMH